MRSYTRMRRRTISQAFITFPVPFDGIQHSLWSLARSVLDLNGTRLVAASSMTEPTTRRRRRPAVWVIGPRFPFLADSDTALVPCVGSARFVTTGKHPAVTACGQEIRSVSMSLGMLNHQDKVNLDLYKSIRGPVQNFVSTFDAKVFSQRIECVEPHPSEIYYKCVRQCTPQTRISESTVELSNVRSGWNVPRSG